MKHSLCLATFVIFLASCGQTPNMSAQGGRYDLGDKVLASANGAVQAEPGEAPPAKASAAPKKIIYTATLDLRVEDFAAAEKEITKLVRESDGYVAEFREQRSQGKRTSGKWVARIPAERFEAFVAQLDSVGAAENKQIDSREVTEEFVDLKSRLASKQQVERRVAELLQKQAGEVRDVIAIETELGRVREEVERIEGRLRYLTDRTELTTVTISVHQTQEFVAAPTTLAGRVSQAFHESLQALATLLEGVLILIVAFAPWLALLIVLLAPLTLVIVIHKRRRRPGLVRQVV